MRRPLFALALTLVAVALSSSFAPSRAQNRLQPVAALTGRPALELALRKLDTVGNLMMTTAHPDDENNALLAYFGHVKGFRTSLVTATRGEGGQNEIGPEIFEALAVLRTEELLAVHTFDGAEQYFTRAVDFGYSFSIEETLEKWGGQVILGDFVRMIRVIRPDVIVGFVFEGQGGGQHHQSSSLLTSQAFRAAADPNAFPDQIAAGLRPWQAKKFYYTAGFGPPRGRGQALQGEGASTLLSFNGGNTYDPMLGRTCNEIAGEARSMHKCQGMSQLLPLEGVSQGFGPPGGPRGYRLRDTVLAGGVNRPDPDMFDGVDTSLAALASFAGPSAPLALGAGLLRLAATVSNARQALATGGSSSAVAPLAAGLKAVRALRGELKGMALGDMATYEIDLRLAQKERQFERALVLAADVRIDAVANDNLVVGGQPVQVQIIAANRGDTAVSLGGALTGFASATGECGVDEIAAKAARNCRMTATVPADARLTAAHFKYATDAARFVLDPDVPAGLPFRPTPFVANVALSIGGEAVSMPVSVASRSEGNLFSGEKRAEMHVVPKFAVSATPAIVIVPASGGAQRDVRVTVVNHSKGPAEAEVTLRTPQGWRASPALHAVKFTREDEAATVRFALSPPAPSKLAAQVKQGGTGLTVSAVAREAGVTYSQGYQVVEYPHTTRRHVLRAPEVMVSVLDLRVKPNVTVGYVMGVGDEVPQALEQLGARVEQLNEDQLAWGDLSKYDVIMTGVRAYERRADLRAYNQRLLDYARAGGTVIVHYNKTEFNQAQYGPYPAKVTRERVTDENSDVRVLVPAHPVFNTPNKITDADWKNWRQERGTYFLDTGDPQYTDLVEFVEPFPNNQGPKLGGLVEARVGTGRWLYLGIGLWRQLPAGTDGAYRLLANLISLDRSGAPTGAAVAPPRAAK